MCLGIIADAITMYFKKDNLDGSVGNKDFQTGMMLFTKVLEVAQVLIFQASIFYAQWLVGNTYDSDTAAGPGADDANEAWLAIEITAFYLVISGAVIFIASTQILNMCYKDTAKTKGYDKEDFISLHTPSINWYSFNVVLFGIPCALLIFN